MKYKNRKGRSESKYHKKENGIIYEIYLFHLLMTLFMCSITISGVMPCRQA